MTDKAISHEQMPDKVHKQLFEWLAKDADVKAEDEYDNKNVLR
jgi:hypothetical protein